MNQTNPNINLHGISHPARDGVRDSVKHTQHLYLVTSSLILRVHFVHELSHQSILPCIFAALLGSTDTNKVHSKTIRQCDYIIITDRNRTYLWTWTGYKVCLLIRMWTCTHFYFILNWPFKTSKADKHHKYKHQFGDDDWICQHWPFSSYLIPTTFGIFNVSFGYT